MLPLNTYNEGKELYALNRSTAWIVFLLLAQKKNDRFGTRRMSRLEPKCRRTPPARGGPYTAAAPPILGTRLERCADPHNRVLLAEPAAGSLIAGRRNPHRGSAGP